MILVSPEDDSLLGLGPPWFVDTRGYVRRNWRVGTGPQRYELLHRLVSGAQTGQIVDHINGDKLDNRRENLRLCSHAENMRNCKMHVNNKLDAKGVYLDKKSGRYRAQIVVDKRRHRLGSFPTISQAQQAYRIASVELHAEFARPE